MSVNQWTPLISIILVTQYVYFVPICSALTVKNLCLNIHDM